jgi:hypothetical protein
MRYEAYIYTRLQGFSQKLEHVETPKSRLSSTFPPVRFRFWGSPFWKQCISLKFTFSPQQPQLLRHISTAPCDSNLARLVSNQWSFLVEWASYCDTTGTVLSFCSLGVLSPHWKFKGKFPEENSLHGFGFGWRPKMETWAESAGAGMAKKRHLDSQQDNKGA